VPRGTVERLPRAALEAGLDVVQADGFFATQEPELGFEIHAGTLAAARGHAVKAGIAAETIDDLVARLRAAKVGGSTPDTTKDPPVISSRSDVSTVSTDPIVSYTTPGPSCSHARPLHGTRERPLSAGAPQPRARSAPMTAPRARRAAPRAEPPAPTAATR